MDQTKADGSSKIAETPELRAAAMELDESLKLGEKAAWRTGFIYNRIIEQKLAEKSGYGHARDFFASRLISESMDLDDIDS